MGQTFNLIWIIGQTCEGNTMALLNGSDPDFFTFLEQNNINLLYHPTISPAFGEEAQQIFDDCLSGKTPVHLFVVEGAVPTREGHGDYFRLHGKIMGKEMIKNFAEQSMLTIALGACASFGGVPNTPPNESGAVGLQWDHYSMSGFLGKEYRSQIGMPVINIPGCPAHPDWFMRTVEAFTSGKGVQLDKFNRPKDIFKEKVHRGCNACEFNDAKIYAKEFTDIGCLGKEKGCKGKIVNGDCNTRLWYNTSSCTRSGHPCIGCTDPGFPGSMLPFDRKDTGLKQEIEERNKINRGGE